jgi:hypothetical protein
MVRDRIAVLAYLFCFLVALGFFLVGHHNLAFTVAYVSWFMTIALMWRPSRGR